MAPFLAHPVFAGKASNNPVSQSVGTETRFRALPVIGARCDFLLVSRSEFRSVCMNSCRANFNFKSRQCNCQEQEEEQQQRQFHEISIEPLTVGAPFLRVYFSVFHRID